MVTGQSGQSGRNVTLAVEEESGRGTGPARLRPLRTVDGTARG